MTSSEHNKNGVFSSYRELGKLASSNRLSIKFSRIRNSRAYWEYLHQGAGRVVLYEKNPPNGQLPKQTKLDGYLGRPETSGLLGESGFGSPSEDTQSSDGAEESDSGDVPEGRDLVFWKSKKEAKPLNFLMGIQQVLQTFPALDVQQLSYYILNHADPVYKEWYQRMKMMPKFSERVNNEIVEMRTCNIDVPWYDILSNTHEDTYKLLCEKEVMSIEESESCIFTILRHNGIKPRDFVYFLHKLIDKKSGKRNAIHFVGEVNSGKTLLANSIIRSVCYYSVLNKVGKKCSESDFIYQPLIGARVALLNECIVNDVNYEDFLQLTEGERMPVQVKYSAPQTLTRVPLIITSNTCLWADCSQWRATMASVAFPERVMILQFTRCNDLIHYAGKDINPYVWKKMIEMYCIE